MASKGQMTGMTGVYLAAAELSKRGFIVSPTSRSAAGADLLVADQFCSRAWSVQVKTNSRPASFWLVGKHAKTLRSDSHIYIFVNLREIGSPDYIIAPSNYVAEKVVEYTAKNERASTWWSFMLKDNPYPAGEGWNVFGDPKPNPQGVHA